MKISKEETLAAYRNYPDTAREGIDDFYIGRIEPLVYEVPFGAKVLDVGANSGEIMKLLAEKRECDCYGIDISETAVAIAKEKGLNVQIGDAEALPFGDNEFDVVLLIETLNHIHDPLKALQEAKRVLRPEGILLGSVPHKNLEQFVWEDNVPHHSYWETTALGDFLDQVFKFSHLWPLKGGQMSIRFADSFLVSETAEILFKCGSTGHEHKWWELMRKKDVLRVWFGPTQHEGDVYYRMRCFADKMRERGIEAAYEHFEDKAIDGQMNWQNRLLIKFADGTKKGTLVCSQLDAILKVADLSVWQLIATPEALAFLLCAKDVVKKPIVTEIDDWILDVPQYNIASGPYRPNSPHEAYILAQIGLSDAIICSTSFIADKLREMQQFEDKSYYVIPNCIDFEIWDHLKDRPLNKPDGVVRIGYTGCGNHGADLYMIREPLQAILNEFPNVELVYAVPQKNPHEPSKDFRLDHPRAKCLNEWHPMKQIPQVFKNWDMDIGLAPLVDNNFNRAKSNLRWLEYSALKIPTVASPVRPFKTSIVNNEDGLLCRSAQEWYNALKELVKSKEQRQRIGETAYARVKRDWNLENVTTRYVEVLEEIKRKAVSYATVSP